MTTIQEYTDAIEVVEKEMKDFVASRLEGNTIVKLLKANRWERVKQLAEQPEKKLEAEKALSKFLLETDGREYDSAYLCEAFLSGYFTSNQREKPTVKK